jgi:uncharacterized low-complexity protein
MKRMLALSAAASLLVVAAGSSAMADSANWDAEKRAQIEQNRTSDSGKGNGGEGNPEPDPGKSGAQCQGGKNPGSC